MSGDDFELDVHQQRRRVLWQRVYIQVLDRLMLPLVFRDGEYRGQAVSDMECSRRAGELAMDAVRRFDEWERTQAPAAAPPARPDGGGEADDDPDDQYLGG